MENENLNSDDFFSGFEKLIKKGTKSNSIPANMPSHFKDCDVIYRSCQGDPKANSLPVTVAVDYKKDEYHLIIGASKEVMTMSFDQFVFFMNSITSLVVGAASKGGTLTQKKTKKKIIKSSKVLGNPNLGSSIEGHFATRNSKNPKMTPDELTEEFLSGVKPELESTEEVPEITSEDKEEVMDQEGNPIKLKSIVDNLQKIKEIEKKHKDADAIDEEEIKEVEAMKADMDKILESLTPAQKEQVVEEMSLKKEELLIKRTKAFEKELLGEIEVEGEIEFNYEYFKAIYKDKGAEFLKEELAKIPKEERTAMITKIVQEFNQKQN